MKKLILSAFAALMICGLQAQEARSQKGHGKMTPEKMAQFETDRMVKELNLDKATEAKIGEINLRFAKEQFAMRQDQKEKNQEEKKQNQSKMRTKMEAMQTEKDKEFEKVLSKKDFATYKQKRDEMRKKMKERRGNGNRYFNESKSDETSTQE